MMPDYNRLKKLKLILFDLDGTLLNEHGMIGDKSKEFVKKLSPLGVQFTFASGRLHSALTEYAKELDIKTPLISLDGALIKSHPEGKVLFESFVPEKYTLKSIQYADKLMLRIALCHADAIYYTEHNSLIPALVDKFGARFEEVDSYNRYLSKTLEVVFVSESKDYLKHVEKHLNFPYSFGLTTSYTKSYNSQGMYYLEVRKKGSTKATGLAYLLKRLKIKITETAVMGDWYNDRELFATKAYKVAMTNAVNELKNLSDYVTDKSNNDDGVGDFLEMVYNAKTK